MNGDLKSLLLLWENLAGNRRYAQFVSKEDIKTLRTRVENEGITFLTTALPSIGKALDSFHATNVWSPPESFKLEDGVPIFLGLPIKLALGGNSLAVDCVRQLTYVFYKLEIDYDKETIGQFLDQFIKTDQDVGLPEGSEFYQELVRDMRRLISLVLANADPLDIRPCHGSGATADRRRNWDKWHDLVYYEDLDRVFSYPDYFFFSPTHLVDEYEKLESSQVGKPQARVCIVPKDSRGPRIISCEPTELMYIQQGLMRKLYGVIEAHPLTKGQVNFTDQTVNRTLAQIASEFGGLATIDLKDASDRVSLQLVKEVFPPRWVEALEACRSKSTLLPDGRVVDLNKFAPMGSSCCFPVEALVFWAASVSSILRQLFSERTGGWQTVVPERWVWAQLRAGLKFSVHVYGDDIITESKYIDAVVKGLETVGLLVNREKTFREGPFRESCGGDFHKGFDVTPVRVRHFLSGIGTGLATCADLANSFIAKFGYEDSHQLIRVIEAAVGYSYPRTERTIPCTLRFKPSAGNDVLFRRRWNKNHQVFEHRVLQLSSKVLTKHPPNWGELLRKELQREIATRNPDKYSSRLNFLNATLDPGQYAATHAARKSWAWVCLG
jgi:hypothetical protein